MEKFYDGQTVKFGLEVNVKTRVVPYNDVPPEYDWTVDPNGVPPPFEWDIAGSVAPSERMASWGQLEEPIRRKTNALMSDNAE